MKKSCAYCFDEEDLKEFEDIDGNTTHACARCLNQELKKQIDLLSASREEIKRIEKSHEEARVYWYKSEQHYKEKAEELEKRLREELGISKPTPETLFEAIGNGLEQSESSTNTIMNIERHIRDYLAQHFNTAMLKAPNPEEEDRFKKLFERAVLYRGLFDDET